MIRYIDIDGTICRTENMDYKNSVPFLNSIKIINEWFNTGDVIVYYTSRGYAICDECGKKELRKFTIEQLESWGCKYHSLRMDKPLFDAYYDDRAFNSVILRSSGEGR
jgi:hypothetical protein